MAVPTHDRSMTTDDLSAIRTICESVLRSNPDDTEVDLVRRLTFLAMPEGAGRVWFGRWQIASQMNTRLREVLADVLTRLDRGESIPSDRLAEAWSVLGDLDTLMPIPQPDDPIDDDPRAGSEGEPRVSEQAQETEAVLVACFPGCEWNGEVELDAERHWTCPGCGERRLFRSSRAGLNEDGGDD